jgi:hypothetical protein
LLHLFKESVEFNLQKLLPGLTSRVVSGSAFTQARYKIKSTFFAQLIKKTVCCYNDISKKLWKGHRLVAGDGSTLNLPVSKDILAYFGFHGVTEFGVKRSLARIFFFYDMLNDFVVHAELLKMADAEHALFRKGLLQLGNTNDILILDRGFGYFPILAELQEAKRLFCVRLSIEGTFGKSILRKKGNDLTIIWTPSCKQKWRYEKSGVPCDPIRIRVIKILLPTGEVELLVTNLMDREVYRVEDINELYQYRWGVEEGLKKLKPKMKIEQFGCRTVEGIYQEFYAHIFCFNMISLAGIIANIVIEKKTQHRKIKYKYNWQNAYRFFREKVTQLLVFSDKVEELIDHLIEQIVSSIISIRPGRKFPRDLKHTKRRRINQFLK